MKQIQPVNIWLNGQSKQANTISMYVVNDNLLNSASFYYQLLSVTIVDEKDTSEQLAQGNLTMSGQDYIDWNVDTDINNAAYTWAAAQLNLTLV